MIFGTLILFSGLSILIYCLLVRADRRKTLRLPGPGGLPLIGNLLQLDKFQHISYSKWAKEFGPIYQIKLFNQRIIVISDHKMLKELFAQSACSGRLALPIFDFGSYDNLHGIVNTEGAHWEELRRFTLRQLRDFSFGRNSNMEESIMTEVNDFIKDLVGTREEPVTNVKNRLLFAVVNAIWFIATGIRHEQGDLELITLIDKLNKIVAEVLGTGVIFFPWLAKCFPKLSGYSRTRELMAACTRMVFQKPIDDHIKTYDENHQRDFTDTFLRQIYASKNPKSAFHGEIGVQNLLGTLADLFLAGSDTTATSLSWMMLYVTKTAGVQEKFQAEIESITGNTRPCSLADRPKMPYTQALIAETLRYCSVASIGVMHKAQRDTEFKGYLIPKGTLLAHNAHYIHHDPAVWGDPQNFRPERFLSADGQSFKNHEALLPFSTGRRQCLGESLARDTLFLFATNIFQRFQVVFDTRGPDNGLEPEFAFLLTPKPFNVIFKDRFQ